jgi:hypothetical protein
MSHTPVSRPPGAPGAPDGPLTRATLDEALAGLPTFSRAQARQHVQRQRSSGPVRSDDRPAAAPQTPSQHDDVTVCEVCGESDGDYGDVVAQWSDQLKTQHLAHELCVPDTTWKLA